MTTPLLTWRVVGWDAKFETRGTLRQRGPREKLTVTTNVEGDELGRLLAMSGGFMAFGVWNLVLRLAAWPSSLRVTSGASPGVQFVVSCRTIHA